MAKTITLRYPARCRDCGMQLPRNTKARWVRRGVVYCLACGGAGAPRSAYEQGDRSPGAIASHYDPRGVYSVDGRRLGTVGPRCEDAPCCGCCS